MSSPMSAKHIHRVGIVGGGNMASTIFKVLLDTDYPVTLWARRPEKVAELEKKLLGRLKRRAKRGGTAGEKAAERLKSVHITADFEQLAGSDVILENVAEDHEIKAEVFRRLDGLVDADTILTTNTSSLCPSALATHVSHPERFAGLHFFQPVSVLNMVELIRAKETRSELMETLKGFVDTLGLRPILVNKELPTFLVNRICVTYYHEGARLVGEGHWLPQDIDRLGRRWFATGPCETNDYVGLDISVQSERSLDTSWGYAHVYETNHRASLPFPDIFGLMVADRRFGLKSGKGFYRYEGGQAIPDDDYIRDVRQKCADYHRFPAYDEETVSRRLLCTVLLEAAIALELEIGSEDDIEFSTKLVLGMEKGPFETIRAFGVDRVRSWLADLHEKYGQRDFVPRGILAA